MNRLQLWPQDSALAASSQHVDPIAPAALSDSEVAYRVFAPLHYEPNYAYPLLIWLHGPGSDERQLQEVMPLVSLRNYVAIGPRGAFDNVDGYRWDDSIAELGAAEQTIFECIELASQQFHIHPQRTFLAGYQCAGTMALRIGLRHPERFAGALSIGGPFPNGSMPLAKLNQSRGLPLFVAQGCDSREYSLDRTCDELRLFHAAGMNVTLRQYSCGDELIAHMLHDIDVWVMERVTGMPSECVSSAERAPDSFN